MFVFMACRDLAKHRHLDDGMNATRRILILSGDADGNLGDHAIVQSICNGLHAICPRAEITTVSADRARAERDYGARVIPPGPGGFVKLCATAMQSDFVLCGGGGLFQDDDSLIKTPYWALRVALMRLLCRRVIGYSLGVGPLNASGSRFFARLAFHCMERVTVRDSGAQKTAQLLTNKNVKVVPDPAILISPASGRAARTWLLEQGVPLDGGPLIGVTARRWFPPRPRIIPYRVTAKLRLNGGGPWHESKRLIALLAKVLDHVIARTGAYVLFLPSYNVPHEGDDLICTKILEQMSSQRAAILRCGDAALYKAVTAQFAAFLGGRLHPSIFAASVGTPVVGLAYNPKFNGFFEQVGLGDQFMDVEDFVANERVGELADLVEAAAKSGRNFRLAKRAEELGDQIRSFNASLFA